MEFVTTWWGVVGRRTTTTKKDLASIGQIGNEGGGVGGYEGGKVESADETSANRMRACAVRELAEETGYQVQNTEEPQYQTTCAHANTHARTRTHTTDGGIRAV